MKRLSSGCAVVSVALLMVSLVWYLLDQAFYGHIYEASKLHRAEQNNILYTAFTEMLEYGMVALLIFLVLSGIITLRYFGGMSK